MGWIKRLSLLAVTLLVCMSWAGLSEAALLKKAKVYYGNSETYASPAVITGSKVFEQIKAYQEIVRKELTSNDAEYWVLVVEASNTFYEVIESVALENRFDLVAEIGSFEKGPESPEDITAAVVAKLKSEK